MRKERKQLIALGFSLVLHGLLAAFLLFSPRFQSSERRLPHRTEVELIDPEKLRELYQAKLEKKDDRKGQIVEQNEQALNDEVDKNSKYLSRHNQKVVRETKAAAFGKFRNTDGSAGEKAVERQLGKTAESKPKIAEKNEQTATERDNKAEKQKTLLTANDGVATNGKPKLKDLMPSFKPVAPPSPGDTMAKGGGDGPSTSDDHLKEVATGMQTLLSTREFVYYTYYNRIRDKLRQYWEPKIKEKMEHIVRQGRTIASNTERITRVVIILDQTGTLVRVQIIGPSGVSDLDDAAAEAFRAAAPFPNPPKGIVDDDGTIKIRWDFILEA